jgi:hypothetical protein
MCPIGILAMVSFRTGHNSKTLLERLKNRSGFPMKKK